MTRFTLEEMGIGNPSRPVALFVIPLNNEPRSRHGTENARHKGYQLRRARPGIYEALARRQHLMTRDPIDEQLLRHQPSIVVIDECVERFSEWREACHAANVRVVVLANSVNERVLSSEVWVVCDNSEQTLSKVNDAIVPASTFPPHQAPSVRRF